MQTRRLRTPRLDVAYLEHGPADGPPVLLLHGFPDDATAWRPAMEQPAAAGRRAVAPYVRGCGGDAGTRFLRPDTPRAGDFAALGNDALAVVDALDPGANGDLTVVGRTGARPPRRRRGRRRGALAARRQGARALLPGRRAGRGAARRGPLAQRAAPDAVGRAAPA